MSQLLQINKISKVYPGVIALDDVSLGFEQGEVHALMGENGAGKSTLIKVIAGAICPNGGSIELNGVKYDKLTPDQAIKSGIAVIYQDINLVQALSVAENIYMGIDRRKIFSFNRICQMATELFARYGFELNPRLPVCVLSQANQELVEICKAISNNARLIIMDEPTAPLSSKEVEILFRIIKQLKSEGVTIIYISHRLDEVFEVSDRISVLRDGKFVKTVTTCQTSREELIALMVGRKLGASFPDRAVEPSEEIALSANNLTGNSVENISFDLHKGEILGFAGLVGSGRTETVELVFGSKKTISGNICINGKPININSPIDAIRYGIGLIPEDRKVSGIIMHNTIAFNITLICNDKFITKGVISSKNQIKVAEEYRQALEIKTPSLQQQVLNLSGGNQQKVVVAKAMAADSDIIIFDEPTKGIDVGAKYEIYQLMNEMTAKGKSIIMISSDMEEILGISDRIVVLYEGRVSGILNKADFSQEKVLALASGIA